MGEITEELARKTASISFGDLPPSVVRDVKRVLLDSVGCALAGQVVERSRIALELIGEVGGNSTATILGAGRTSWPWAAYANAELMNALDFDALGPFAGHVVPFVLPPSLAMAERARASGQQLIAALATGIEVGGRVASALPGHRLPAATPPFYKDNPGLSFSVTVFGAVVAAGKAMGMDTDRLANALGIAGTNIPAPTCQKWEHTPGPATMMKYGCSTGLLAQLATTAVLLAERGFTADAAILDGEWSLQRIFGVDHYEPRKIVSDLGEVWHIDAMTIKSFPCCGANHTGIQALIRVLSENSIDPEDIEEIIVMGDPLMLTPNRAQRRVLTHADAQFSNAYIFGLTPYYGTRPSPAWQLPQTFNDPRITAMMEKVKVLPHPNAEEILRRQASSGKMSLFRDALVEVQAKGRWYSAEEKVVRGSAKASLSDEELTAKFLTNCSYSSLRASKVRRAADIIYRLEEVDDVCELMSLLRVH